MAFPTYIGKGTFTESTSNPSGNPPLPSGIQNGDLIIAVVSYPVTNTPSSSDSAWTLLAQTSTGTSGNAGCIGVGVFYAIYAGSALGGFSTNGSFPLKTYQTYAFRKARIPSISATSVQSTAATSWTLPSITTADNDSFVFFAIGNDRDAASTANVSGYTNSNLANITEIHDQTVATGLGGGLATVYAEVANPESIDDTNCTSASSNTAAFVTFAIGPAVITADAGTYSYTGTAANTRFNRKIAADSGSYSYTGTDANFSYARVLIAEATAANVNSLLHFNGPDGSTTFYDEARLTWTVSGNAQIDTSKSVFGGASGLFDGTGDYITADNSSLIIGTGDFTIEAWIYRNVSATHNIISWSGNNAIYMNVGNNTVFVQTGGTNRISAAGTTGAWFHVAVCRQSGVLMLFIDGVKAATTPTITTDFTGSNIEIGRRVGSTNTFNGWVDEFRFSNGVARYTSDFTPATTEFGLYQYTGTTANTVRGWKVTADPGSYSYTGTAATLTYTPSGAFTLTADPGSYSYAGTDASVLFNSRLAADSGSYSYSGTDATLTYTPVNAYTITADPGTYSYSGTDAGVLFNRKVIAESGSYSYAGSDAALIIVQAIQFPTYVGKGTFSTSTALLESPDPPLPSGIQNGDLIIAVLTYPVTNIPSSSDSSWTRLASVSTGTSGSAGCVGVSVFYAIYRGSALGGFSTSISVPLKIYQTYAFRNASKPSISATAVQSTAATSWTLPGITTANEGGFVFFAIGNDRDADSTDNVSGYTNSNLSNITEIHDQTVSTSQGGGIAAVYAEDAVPGAIGTTSCTSVSSNTAAFITFAIGPSILRANPGAYSYTGTAAGLTYSTYSLSADSGSYSYSGTDATTLFYRKVTADAGTYSYIGTAATLTYAQPSTYTLTADSGVYAYSGTSATLTYASGLTNILLGSSTVTSIKLGTTTVTKVYLGTTKVFG